MCTATIETDHIKIIGYVFGVYLLALVAGKLLAPLAGKKYAHFSPYLLTVVEGGNVHYRYIFLLLENLVILLFLILLEQLLLLLFFQF